jgi:protein-disulfide isomerase
MAKLTLPVDPARDHVSGPDTAPVTLVEYGDYECPHCGAAHPIVNRVRAHFGDRLRFVFRNFPLTELHPHAEHAAEAAEAAAAQGKFWEMHDTIFEHQRHLTDADLAKLAEGVGVDPAPISAAIAGETYLDHVREDFMSGVRSGVNGTPTFFINGVRHDDSWDEETLTAALEAAAGQKA